MRLIYRMKLVQYSVSRLAALAGRSVMCPVPSRANCILIPSPQWPPVAVNPATTGHHAPTQPDNLATRGLSPSHSPPSTHQNPNAATRGHSIKPTLLRAYPATRGHLLSLRLSISVFGNSNHPLVSRAPAGTPRRLFPRPNPPILEPFARGAPLAGLRADPSNLTRVTPA